MYKRAKEFTAQPLCFSNKPFKSLSNSSRIYRRATTQSLMPSVSFLNYLELNMLFYKKLIGEWSGKEMPEMPNRIMGFEISIMGSILFMMAIMADQSCTSTQMVKAMMMYTYSVYTCTCTLYMCTIIFIVHVHYYTMHKYFITLHMCSVFEAILITHLCIAHYIYTCNSVLKLSCISAVSFSISPGLNMLHVIIGHLQPLHTCLDEVQVKLHRWRQRNKQ